MALLSCGPSCGPICGPTLLRQFEICVYISLWYFCSISMTLYNKWLFSLYGLPFPMTITALHIFVKIPMARIAIRLLRLPPPRISAFGAASDVRQYFGRHVAPSGAATALDIALSNLALMYTTITYYTICKSSVPIWIFFFSVWYRLIKVV